MIVIGVDAHKRSHTLVALDAGSGATRGQLTISATEEGALDALRFAAVRDEERVWAVEDCRHVSGRLEAALVASGDRVIRVAPGLTQDLTPDGPRAGQIRPDRRDRDSTRRAARRH